MHRRVHEIPTYYPRSFALLAVTAAVAACGGDDAPTDAKSTFTEMDDVDKEVDPSSKTICECDEE